MSDPEIDSVLERVAEIAAAEFVRLAARDFLENPDADLREHVRDAGQIAASEFLGYDGRSEDPYIICEARFFLMAHGDHAARREIVRMRAWARAVEGLRWRH